MIRQTLVHAVTSYDRKQENKASYNIYALSQYLKRVDDIMRDIDAGANVYDAINAGTHGALRNHIVRAIKKSHPDIEQGTQTINNSSWTYKPVKAIEE